MIKHRTISTAGWHSRHTSQDAGQEKAFKSDRRGSGADKVKKLAMSEPELDDKAYGNIRSTHKSAPGLADSEYAESTTICDVVRKHKTQRKGRKEDTKHSPNAEKHVGMVDAPPTWCTPRHYWKAHGAFELPACNAILINLWTDPHDHRPGLRNARERQWSAVARMMTSELESKEILVIATVAFGRALTPGSRIGMSAQPFASSAQHHHRCGDWMSWSE
ncbi:hypothetical protein AC578_9855 [Pseudocercospora eumusae]|uniref:Uncharacterized protein n=1 Tax=Pseudocercospora eumusae TaxID=321146 RepID=A0A139HB68_9PEZI|nr:hypothetical protein AC578_9855 [Pseudocercospora eumusae]